MIATLFEGHRGQQDFLWYAFWCVGSIAASCNQVSLIPIIDDMMLCLIKNRRHFLNSSLNNGDHQLHLLHVRTMLKSTGQNIKRRLPPRDPPSKDKGRETMSMKGAARSDDGTSHMPGVALTVPAVCVQGRRIAENLRRLAARARDST